VASPLKIPPHETMCDLVRARHAAAEDLLKVRSDSIFRRAGDPAAARVASGSFSLLKHRGVAR
jgi:hypothetical protein